MAITVPVANDEIEAETFGAPVAQWINAYTPGAWTAFPLTGNVSNLANNQPLQYRKVGDMVQMRGVVVFSVAVPVSSEVAIGALPAGFRPPIALIMFGICGWIGESHARININASTGQVSIKPNIAFTANENFTSFGLTAFSTI